MNSLLEWINSHDDVWVSFGEYDEEPSYFVVKLTPTYYSNLTSYTRTWKKDEIADHLVEILDSMYVAASV